MEEIHILKVFYGKISKPFLFLRAICLIPLFLLSLTVYLVGLLLVFTLVGAILGVPIIISTYVFDVMLIGFIVNPLASLKKINCPLCKKGKLIVTDIMGSFVCKGCGEFIKIERDIG